MQVAIVDADDFGPGTPGGKQLVFVMNFNQCLKPKLTRRRVERSQLGLFQHRGDQQNTIGAGRTRLMKLVGVEDKILAQKREVNGYTHVPQILKRAFKMSVGQDRDCGRS